MSRRLPTSLASVFLLLLLGAATAPFLSEPAAAFGERAFASNTVISGTSHLKVYAAESVAQSFLATDGFRLLNVTLRLQNGGDTSDALNITIRADAGGTPSSTILAARTTVIGTGVLGNYNIAFPAPAILSAGTLYWIVATSSSLLVTNAYQWHHSAADTYAGGEAKVNSNLGGGWTDPSSPTDLYFVAYGRETEANLSVTIIPTQAQANPGDAITFRVFLNNSGHSTSPAAWLNDTPRAGLTYVSDTAGLAGATTVWPSFAFSGVGNGARSFDLTFRVDLGTEPGTRLTETIALSYADSSGTVRSRPPTEASILVGFRMKSLYLSPEAVGPRERLSPVKPTGGLGSQSTELLVADGSAHEFDLEPVLVRSFRVMTVTATLYLDSALHDSRDLDINITVADWNGVSLTPIAFRQQRVTTNAFNDYQAFTFAFPATDHTFSSGSRIRLTARNLATSGSGAFLAMNSTLTPSRVDFGTTTYVRVDLLDLRDARDSAVAWSPKDSLIVEANVSDPLGSAEITVARINLTSPSGGILVNYTAMAVLAVDPSLPSAWKRFRFTYAPPLSLGTYRVRVTAFEANGALDIEEAGALVRAPAFTLVKTATRGNVAAGEVFTYQVWFNNTGTGPAGRVWINDTLPSGITFLGSSDPGAMTGDYNWTWAAPPLGNSMLSLQVQVNASLPATPYGRNRVSLEFVDEKGFSWPGQAATADVAFRGPVIELTQTAKSALHANESITYVITMRNTGDLAQTLWVNDTFPANLTYVSNTSEALGGTPTGNPLSFRFTNMPSQATWTFTITAAAGPGLDLGEVLRNSIALDYTNADGFLLPPRASEWIATGTAPAILSASAIIAQERPTPADVLRAKVVFTNEGNEPARDLWVNLSLDLNLTYLNASSLPAFSSGSQVRFMFASIPVGIRTLFLNASVRTTVEDRSSLAIRGMLAYADGLRQRMPSIVVEMDFVEIAAPRMVTTVTPTESEVEAGSLVFYTVFQTNAGSGVAGDVWVTLRLPAGLVFQADGSDGAWTPQGANYQVHWVNFAPGTRTLSLALQARPTVANGTLGTVYLDTMYTDANGNLRPGNTTTAVVHFIAPWLDITLTVSAEEGRPGDRIVLDLRFQNLGSPISTLWLTLDIRAAFDAESVNANVPHSGTKSLNWTFSDVAYNGSEPVLLSLRILPAAVGTSPNFLQFNATYTNGAGVILRTVPSRQVTISVLPVADSMLLVWLGFAGTGLGLVAAFVVRRQMGIQIEEVFLVYRDGVLIYHLSRSLSQDKDEDVLSGMLTAVQEFVRDAFMYGERRNLLNLDFGDYRIMIERGRAVYLAVVYSGKGASTIRRRVLSVLNQIETVYGRVLEKWDGDMDKVVGARDLIREYLLKSSGRRPFKGLPGLP